LNIIFIIFKIQSYTNFFIIQTRYNKICGQIRKLCNKLSLLDPRDPYRNQMSENLLDKLYNMGIIGTKRTLSQANKVTVSAFCR